MVLFYMFGAFLLIVSCFMYYYAKNQKEGILVNLNIINIDTSGEKDEDGIIINNLNSVDVEFELKGKKINKRIYGEQNYNIGEKIEAIYYPKNDSFTFNKKDKPNIYFPLIVFIVSIVMLTIAVFGTVDKKIGIGLEENLFSIIKYLFSIAFVIGGILSISVYLRIKNKPKVDAEIIGVEKGWSSVSGGDSMSHSRTIYHYRYKYYYNGEKVYLSDLDVRFPKRQIGDHRTLIIDGKDVYEKSLKIHFIIEGIVAIIIGLLFLFLVFNGII